MTETIIIGSTAIYLETPIMKDSYFIDSDPDGSQNIMSGYISTGVKTEESFYCSFYSPVLTTISGGEIPVIVKELCPTHCPENVIEPVTKERLHKQPRGYLKTVASLVGRDRNNRMLWNLPYDQRYDHEADERDTISKNIAIAGNYLLQLWQRGKDAEGWLVIKNLTKIARVLGTTTQRFKLYLIYLGGYKYPIITYSDHESLFTSKDQRLFDIKFDYINGSSSIYTPQNSRIGTRHLSFQKGSYVKRIRFRPISETRDELKGKKRTLGNILVSDHFLPFCLDLSDMAYKLACFTASNKPKGKYRADTIMEPRFLNLDRQLETQGKPRILESIKKAFRELDQKGYIGEWGYNAEGDLFTWMMTDRVVKHPELRGNVSVKT